MLLIRRGDFVGLKSAVMKPLRLDVFGLAPGTKNLLLLDSVVLLSACRTHPRVQASVPELLWLGVQHRDTGG